MDFDEWKKTQQIFNQEDMREHDLWIEDAYNAGLEAAAVIAEKTIKSNTATVYHATRNGVLAGTAKAIRDAIK